MLKKTAIGDLIYAYIYVTLVHVKVIHLSHNPFGQLGMKIKLLTMGY